MIIAFTKVCYEVELFTKQSNWEEDNKTDLQALSYSGCQRGTSQPRWPYLAELPGNPSLLTTCYKATISFQMRFSTILSK